MFQQLTSRIHLGFLTLISLLVLTFAVPHMANGARITKVKGRKVYIKLEGENIRKGDRFSVIDPNSGRKKGLVKVRKVKGSKAYGIMSKKSKAKVGWTLKQKSRKRRRSKRTSEVAMGGSTTSTQTYEAAFGLMGGFAMNTMDVDLTSTTTSMSGNGFSAKAFVDYQIFPQVWFRGLVGYESFQASSDDKICGENPSTELCEVSLGYLTADLWGRYMFLMDAFRPWVGGGFSLLFPMSKETTAVDESSVTNTSMMLFGAGFDWVVSPRVSIPFQVEYGLFPSSEDVGASSIAVRFGIGLGF